LLDKQLTNRIYATILRTKQHFVQDKTAEMQGRPDDKKLLMNIDEFLSH